MQSTLGSFLKGSPIAERVRPEARLVLQRTRLSLVELAAVRQAGKYGPIPDRHSVCELEVGGQVLARGKIVRKRGAYYLRITEVIDGDKKNQKRGDQDRAGGRAGKDRAGNGEDGSAREREEKGGIAENLDNEEAET